MSSLKNLAMKKLITFFPPIVFMCLVVVLGACESSTKDSEIKKEFSTDSASLKHNIKEQYQEVKPLDSLDTVPIRDSVVFDTSSTIQDTIPFSNETHVIPSPKPTYKVFSKYMKLHRRGPIV
jgi:hypothetical protein